METNEQVNQLERRVAELENTMHQLRHSFTSKEVFMKSVVLANGARLKLDNLSTDPATGEVGEIIMVSGTPKRWNGSAWVNV